MSAARVAVKSFNALRKRRRWQRLPIAVPMFVRGENHRPRVIELATAVNIGAGGALIAVKRNLPLRTAVEVEIPRGPVIDQAILKDSVSTLRGRVVRSTPGERCYLLAVKWDAPLIESNSSTVRASSRTPSPRRRPLSRAV
jgi:hypothetical protein